MAIIFTIFILILLFRYLFYRQNTPTADAIESESGYTPESHELDNFSISGIKKIFKRGERRTQNNPGNNTEMPDATIEQLKTEIDAKIDQRVLPIEADITNIYESIDALGSSK